MTTRFFEAVLSQDTWGTWRLPAELPDHQDLRDLEVALGEVGATEIPDGDWPTVEGDLCQYVVALYRLDAEDSGLESIHAILAMDTD